MLIGRWKQHNYGKRVLTVHDDGTATMVVEPAGVWTYLFGEKLRFEIRWSLHDGHLEFETIGGEPADKVMLATKTFGGEHNQAILTLTANRLVLEKDDGEPAHGWQRVSSTSE